MDFRRFLASAAIELDVFNDNLRPRPIVHTAVVLCFVRHAVLLLAGVQSSWLL